MPSFRNCRVPKSPWLGFLINSIMATRGKNVLLSQYSNFNLIPNTGIGLHMEEISRQISHLIYKNAKLGTFRDSSVSEHLSIAATFLKFSAFCI